MLKAFLFVWPTSSFVSFFGSTLSIVPQRALFLLLQKVKLYQIPFTYLIFYHKSVPIFVKFMTCKIVFTLIEVGNEIVWPRKYIFMGKWDLFFFSRKRIKLQWEAFSGYCKNFIKNWCRFLDFAEMSKNDVYLGYSIVIELGYAAKNVLWKGLTLLTWLDMKI